MADIADAAICDLTPEVIRNSVFILKKSTVRAMDAIHVGSALTLPAHLFVSADARQCAAELTAGLRVEQA